MNCEMLNTNNEKEFQREESSGPESIRWYNPARMTSVMGTLTVTTLPMVGCSLSSLVSLS